MCFWRQADGQRLLALHNLSDEAIEITLPEGFNYRDVLLSRRRPRNGKIELEPYGYRWLMAE
jgi:hypothetical protein